MNVKIISCWFATSYGAYSDGLRQALERRLGNEVGIIASNCGCGDPVEVRREFQNRRCDYFEYPHVEDFKSANPVKYWLRTKARQVVLRQRAKRYLARTGDSDVLHFQQTLNAYGSISVFNWLTMPSPAARVVTVHEMDTYQVDFPKSNITYNKADRVIVHSNEMKQNLVSVGVESDRIDIVEYGVEIHPIVDAKREGIVFYGGHKLHSGKGLGTLLRAMSILRKRLGSNAPVLKIHGHYGANTPEYGLREARAAGIEDGVRWLNQISLDAVISEYQRSLLCVLPYTGSFAAFPAVNAMANGLPVIGTRRAGLPDHLGSAGTWVEPDDAEGLADAIGGLLADDARRRDLAAIGRSQAEAALSWDIIAQKTLDSYRRAVRHKEQQG